MTIANLTQWTLIEGARAGEEHAREDFVRRYEPAIRAYLAARWRGSGLAESLDDAVQETLLACFRPGGVLERVDASRAGGFRAFLYGVVRRTALIIETRHGRKRESNGQDGAVFEAAPAHDKSPSKVFDQHWAEAVLAEAMDCFIERARTRGPDAIRRVELLELKVGEGLPTREVARRWGVDPARLYQEYPRARREFKAALLEVMAAHRPGTAAEVEKACESLLTLVG